MSFLFFLILLFLICFVWAFYNLRKPFARFTTLHVHSQAHKRQRFGCRRFSPSKLALPNRVSEVDAMTYDYIIIGSGASGLTCAAILARMGFRVLVLEKHPTTAGGSLHTFRLTNSQLPLEATEGLAFDSGLHYTVPQSAELLQLATGRAFSFTRMVDRTATHPHVFEKVFLVPYASSASDQPLVKPLEIGLGEAHLATLRAEARASGTLDELEQYLRVSTELNNLTPIYLASKLLPKSLQPLLHRLFLSSFHTWAAMTTEEALKRLLPHNKRLQAIMCSLWIDAAVRPDASTFWLMSCIQRGLPKEGGAYPHQGSSKMMEQLVASIEECGGQVLIAADVVEISTCQDRAIGVVVQKTNNRSKGDVTACFARHGVISSIGYRNTHRLSTSPLSKRLLADPDIPEASDSFIMANIIIRGQAHDYDIGVANIWHHPSTADGDLFDPIRHFYADPFAADIPFPALITWPSLKDSGCNNNQYVTCQILIPANVRFFKDFFDIADRTHHEGYQQLKDHWKHRSLQLLFHYFPKIAHENIVLIDLSTPLTTQDWLSTDEGSAVGLASTPSRFSLQNCTKFDPQTEISNLWLTGQDIVLPGVAMAQLGLYLFFLSLFSI